MEYQIHMGWIPDTNFGVTGEVAGYAASSVVEGLGIDKTVQTAHQSWVVATSSQTTWGQKAAAGAVFTANAALFGTMLAPGGGQFDSLATRAAEGSAWVNRFPGVQVRQFGDYWVKRVNPDSSSLMQSWGQMTINRQASALDALRAAGSPAANSRLFSSGRLVVENVGTPLGYGYYLSPSYWSARIRDSAALGTPINDLRPGNYGSGYRAFDPAIDPIQAGIGIVGGSLAGWGAYEYSQGGQ
jgi:hypothetical protein